MDYSALFTHIGFDIPAGELLTEAFTHRSSVNEHKDQNKHNERLEFLGDAVLELVVTEALFHQFPDQPEGELTNYRSALVKGEHLAQVARRLDMGQYLIMSHGERKSGGAEKDYLLANVVEAFIGAVYLSLGYDMAKKFIEGHIMTDLDEILKKGLYIDAKSKFQELTQAEMAITPHYEVLKEEGLDHDKTFYVGAYLENKKVGEGEGRSKKEAQLAAAADALTKQESWLKKS